MEALKKDPVMGNLVERYGEVSLEPADDPFRRLVVSIVNQQLSGASARSIRERLFERFEPEPGAILSAGEEELLETGLSHQKVEYLKNVARAFGEDGLSREYFSGMEDEEVIDALTDIKGVGTWTAKMFLMFVLAREDVFPVEDLGVRHAMEELYEIGDRQEMERRAGRWRPYRSYATLYLWKHVD